MVSLDCQATHCIKPKSVFTKDYDALYAIFTLKIGQDIAFVRNWLHHMHKKQFEVKADNYLKPKV